MGETFSNQPLPGHASSHGRITTSAIKASVLQVPACGTVYHRTCDETWTLRVSSVNWKHFYSGVSQPRRIMTLCLILRLRNTLTYLLTYLLTYMDRILPSQLGKRSCHSSDFFLNYGVFWSTFTHSLRHTTMPFCGVHSFVRPSSSGIESKQVNISSNFFHHWVAPPSVA